ncbi:protein NO VEIN domain-containing protein, partial [Planktothrix agardhii]|uniref:protein NO VEIN domain-containing protein n=1 Tax=Planktothrix agardhii TaxID=1160 RepID=UPI002876268E
EGINLQFCRLMINYDLPWNPNRLEQRMGRIHRIGQEHEVYIFNFVAITTVEGRVLNKLLTKLEEIKNAMGDRVFDVIGQLLQVNEIRFEDLVREATYSQADEDEAMETIDRLTPERLQALEKATGLALATSHVDLTQICTTQTQDYRSEEQRLMPYYVEEFFRRACEYLRVNLEVRADGLWRIPYLKEEFRSEQLEAVRRLGTPEKNYPKLTFYKQHLEVASHQDAEFISPGHCLFAALAERLDRQLEEQVGQQTAIFTDADTDTPYRCHFFKVQIEGQTSRGEPQIFKAQLCAVAEQFSGELSLITADGLHDLSAVSPTFIPESGDILHPLTPTEQQKLESWLKVKVQLGLMTEARTQRQRELQIRQDYLKTAMDTAIREAKGTYMKLASKVAQGDETYRVARDSSQNKVRTLQERYKTKQTELDYLQIVRPGRVMYLGTALVYPTPQEALTPMMRNDPEVEAFAIQFVMDYERQQGWQPEDVSHYHDGSGFDIRSIGPSPDNLQPPPVRRIEVKGRAQFGQGVSLTANEWRKALQLGDSYWLYVVWGCHTSNPELLRIPNPTQVLARDAKEIQQVTRYLVEGEALQRNALI